MRISITVLRSDVELNSDFVTLEVPADMTLNDIKALVEDETNAPSQAQHFVQNGQPVLNTGLTLSQLNIDDGDILSMVVRTKQEQPTRRRRASQETPATAPQAQRSRQGQDPERLRLHLLGDSRMMEAVRRENPRLAEAAQDQARFHALFQDTEQQLLQEQRDKERQLALLEADPFDVEAQRKIEEMIRGERIQENLQQAMEENPESFGRVNMLYIDVTVNNVPIKAFVDSGAQTTIMSPDAAQRCNITHLIDSRFGGIAVGVGTAKILGRVHSAYMQIGQYSLASSFTVMEGKDVDLLLGLDMLKRHQMCIDLKENCLRVQGDQIQFLPEHEIPKRHEEVLESEPKIEGPGGSTIGATSGTVEPPPQSSSTSRPETGPNVAAAASSSSASASASTTAQRHPQQSSGLFGSPQPVSPQSIAQITELGFSREEAIAALQQAGGNVELAIGLLL